MAVEQSGAEASPGSAKAEAQETEAQQTAKASLEDTAKADLEELKRKFREALERKRGTHGSGSAEGAQDTGKVHGSHGPETSRRSFRRKSGG